MAGSFRGPRTLPGLAPVDAGRPGARAAQDRSARRPERSVPSLPPELAFLPASGLAPPNLLGTIAAAPAGVRPLDVVLGEGLVGEEAYYRALAKRLGCGYYSGDPPFAQEFDPIRALRCGVAPLDPEAGGPRAVIAPRAQSAAMLIETVLSGRLRPDSFALTSPQRFAALVRARRGETLLAAVLGRLPRELSASCGMTAAQKAAAVAIAAGACALTIARFDVFSAAVSMLLWTTFCAAIVLRSMALVAGKPETHTDLLSDDELPVYTVVIALYREAAVVADLVAALDALDYPKSKLDIKLVVERRDLETLGRISELRLPARYEIVVAPAGEPKTKPRALNIALGSARGDLVVVYDAEDAPARDQLRLAATRFADDPALDCLQGRLVIRNAEDSWLSRLFSLEYAALFDFINPGLCALGLPIALGGTSNHFRIDALADAGAWDEWNVTEDADLGIRLARLGYRVAALDSDTSEEAPHEFGNWFRQRVRWQKGWMQTIIVHSRHPVRFARELGPRRAVAATTLFAGAIVSSLFWPAFAASTIWRALSAASGGLSAWREFTDVFVYILALAGVWTVAIPTPAHDRASAPLLWTHDRGDLDGHG
jgi:glycosyltransferase XagB